MTRYTTRPTARGWIEDHTFDDQKPLIPGCSVDDHVPTFTGLLDTSGRKIWREPRPVGFGRDGDW